MYNFWVFFLNFFFWTPRMQFWQISRCSICQNSDSLAQSRKTTERSITSSKQIFQHKKFVWTGKLLFLWKNLLKNCRKKNKQLTRKSCKNFPLNPKLMRKPIASSAKSCYFKRFLWIRRIQCQEPCQKIYSPVQNLGLKSQNDEKSRKICLNYFYSQCR